MPYGQQPIPTPKKAAARRTYELALLWLPPRPEDPISGLISGLPSEPATSRRGTLETLESFDPRAPIPQAPLNPAPKQTSHKRQISEAIPQNERLNSPETHPAAALEQGPEHTQEDTQEDTQEAGAAGGHEGPNSAIEVQLQCKWCLGIARIAQSVTPVTVIHSTA